MPETAPPCAERGWLAAFGKHPGWDDHMDDIGLVTDDLVAFKRLLYFEGVGANIDAGTWAKLPEPHRLPGFGHAFLACGGGRTIHGRLWASRDRKGRALYPMVTCAQIESCALAPSAEVALPLLGDLQAQCQATEDAAAVRAAVAALHARLSRELPGASSDAGLLTAALRAPASLALWAAGLPPKEEALGLQRVGHRIARDLAAFRDAPPARLAERPAQHLRVPACDASAGRALLLWVGLLRKTLPEAVPLLLFSPLSRNWVDILIGVPQAKHFSCLLADHEAIPLVTEVPYSLDPDAKDKTARLLDTWRSEPEGGLAALWQQPGKSKERSLGGLWQRVQALVRS